jgi:hypothetical protein
MKKVVLDTNLFIGGYWNKKSASYKIIDLCIKEKFIPVFTSQTKKEINFILNNIKAHQKYKKKIEKFFQNGKEIKNIKRLKIIKEDPEDDKFLECAKAAKADYIITNDRHLLNLKKFGKIKIIRPSNFIYHFQKSI